jgi:hypothetical protein
VIVTDEAAVLPGNARSIACWAATDGAPDGRNEVWSVDPAPARLGAKTPMNTPAMTQAITIRNRKR